MRPRDFRDKRHLQKQTQVSLAFSFGHDECGSKSSDQFPFWLNEPTVKLMQTLHLLYFEPYSQSLRFWCQ